MALLTQDRLNTEMRDAGKSRYWNQVTEARAKAEQSHTSCGKRLLSAAFAPASARIAQHIAENSAKGAVRTAAAFRRFRDINPELLGLIVSRHVIDGLGLRQTTAKVANLVGRSVEDEVRFGQVRKQHPSLWRKLENQLDRCTSEGHKRTVIVLTANRIGIRWEPWPKDDRLQVGLTLIRLFCESTGLATLESTREGRKTVGVIEATEKTTEWVRQYHEHAEVLSPVWLPMLDIPEDWSSPFRGGYNSEELVELGLVKRANRAHLTALAAREMPAVYASVNALQRTPWRIDTRVLKVIETLWNNGIECGALPPRTDVPLPPRPAALDNEDPTFRASLEYRKTLKAWKVEATRAKKRNAALKSLRVSAVKLLHIANKFTKADRFYFPYQLDFRGRVYALPSYLSPQGDDLARSLLVFADGCVVNDEADVEWLKIYGANLYGVDKVSFTERKAWVDAHRAEIQASALDPLGCRFWQDADEPWKFLGWCFEWHGWLTTGPGFVTRLPVCVDGTNNGLQLLALLTRDEVAAEATNVSPSATPQDVYGNVAKLALARMAEQAANQDEPAKPVVFKWEIVASVVNDLFGFDEDDQRVESWEDLTAEDVQAIHAGAKEVPETVRTAVLEKASEFSYQPGRACDLSAHWLAFGVDRKATKRPVMVLPYGGTFQSCRDYTRDWYEETAQKKGHVLPEPLVLMDQTHHLAMHVWQSIGLCVTRPRAAMEWLQKLAGLLEEVGKPVSWTTPAGYLVSQAYRTTTARRIKTVLGGVEMKLQLVEETPTLDRRRQKNGISPNFVHSLDAAALMKTVTLCRETLGITSFCMIHDSYGTHAPRMHELAAALRHTFAEMFSPDLLSKFRDECVALLPEGTEVPPVPEFGKLDPTTVRDSEFFFA